MAAAALLAATVVSAAAAVRAGNAQKAATEYNAIMAEQGAKSELQQAGEREAAKRRQTAMILGTQRAAIAQSGGGMGGSAADVMQQSATNAELDALTLRYEGELRARGMQSSAVAERFAGRNAQQDGYFRATSSVLSGAGNYMGATAKKPGVT